MSRLEKEYKQLMKTKEDLKRLEQRQKEEQEWKIKIDQEYESKNNKLSKDLSEKQKAVE